MIGAASRLGEDMADPLVSVIIVNFNAGDYLHICLESLQKQTLEDIEVIVVDNASSDGSLDSLAGFPLVRLIRNSHNTGFAAAQNQGFAVAQGKFMVALNYDLVMMPNFIYELVRALDIEPTAGWACGKLLNMAPDGERSNTLYAAGHAFAPDRFHFLRGVGETDRGQYDQKEFVFGAPGAAAMYRREMIDDIRVNGQFYDEHLFTWYEDVDVDWRATRAGWRCLYIPSAVAYHVGHIGEVYQEPYRSWRAMYGIRNRWLVIFANDTLKNLVVGSRSLLGYELSLLLFVLRGRLVKGYIQAIVGVLHSVPYIRWKRRMRGDGPEAVYY